MHNVNAASSFYFSYYSYFLINPAPLTLYQFEMKMAPKRPGQWCQNVAYPHFLATHEVHSVYSL